MVQLSHPYMTTGKTIALRALWTFVSKVMSLLFNTPSKREPYLIPFNLSRLQFTPLKMRQLKVTFLKRQLCSGSASVPSPRASRNTHTYIFVNKCLPGSFPLSPSFFVISTKGKVLGSILRRTVPEPPVGAHVPLPLSLPLSNYTWKNITASTADPLQTLPR